MPMMTGMNPLEGLAMFNSIYMYAALGIAGVCGGVIAASVLYKFLRWVSAALWMQGCIFIEASSEVLIQVVAVIATALKNLICGFLGFIWNVLATVFLITSQPVKVMSIRVGRFASEYAKLRQLYWKYGHEDFESFETFKRHMIGEEQAEPEPEPYQPEPPRNNFEEAQKILGFSGEEPNTLTELKARHRKLIGMLHPDKGMPSNFFAQQVNDAVTIIMKARKWK